MSTPCLATLLMLASCGLMNPPAVVYPRATNASCKSDFHQVRLMLARSPNSPSSAPASISVDTSGLSPWSPRFDGRTPGPCEDVCDENVVNLSKASGWRPDLPIAARNRTVENVALLHPSACVGMI